MIESFQRLFMVTLLVISVRSEILKAKDTQMCAHLCSSCGGSETFVNEICTCLIPENDEQAAHCMNQLKQKTENSTMSANATEEDIANRAARCSGQLGSSHKIGSEDIDRVARYFIKGGPLTGSSLLGSSNSGCVSSPNNEKTGASNPVGQSNPPVSKTPPLSSPAAKTPPLDAQAPTSPIVGASCEKSPLVSSPKLPSLGLHPTLGAPHPLGILQPHGLTAWHPQLLGALHYPGLLGASQHTQLNPLLGALATGTHDIIQNVDNLVSAYLPGSNREQQVGSPRNKLANAATGVPIGLLGAAGIPAYLPGMLQATHYSPLLGAVASGTHDVLRNLDKLVSSLSPGSGPTKMVGAPHAQNSQSSSSSATGTGGSGPSVGSQAAQQPSPLQQVLAHHNNLLEALSEHLRSIGPQVGAPILRNTLQSRNGIVGAANSMPSCPLQKQASPTLGDSNPIAAETSGQSDESANKKVSEGTTLGSAANSNTSNDSTSNNQDVVKAKETITENPKEEATGEETAEQTESANEVITENTQKETAEKNDEEPITGNAKEETTKETAEQAESTNEVITGSAKEATKQDEEPATDGQISIDGALHKSKRNVYFSTRRKRQNNKYTKKAKKPLLPLRAF